MMEKFRFTCLCSLCSLPEDESLESDKRIEEMSRLESPIEVALQKNAAMVVDPLRVLRWIDQKMRLNNEQYGTNLDDPLPFARAAQIVVAHGDLARCQAFARRAVRGWAIRAGWDSAEVSVYQEWIKNTMGCEAHGMTKKWKTKLGDIHYKFGSQDHDDWLWRRHEAGPQLPKMPANLVKVPHFPHTMSCHGTDKKLRHGSIGCFWGKSIAQRRSKAT